jgi:hypothetical protein
MVTDQLDLAVRIPAPEVSPEQVEQLVTVLHVKNEKKNNWMTAEEIAGRLKLSERLTRKIASASAPTIVSYPGSPGYKLWSLCTVEEINHAIESFEAQARDMIKRANLYRMAYHRRFRGQS